MSELLSLNAAAVDLPLSGSLSALFGAKPRRLNILSGISLSLGQGETLGLVGESGSGKTTLGRALLGLVPLSEGTVRFAGAPLTSRRDFMAMRRASAMMFQDAVASLSPRLTVGSAVTEPLRIAGRRVSKTAAAELLDKVGLSASFAARYPHELSGGQARRVGVARALALDPRLIIADEPTAGLDVSVQGEILNLLTGLRSSLGLSYIIITHNLAIVRHVADRIAVLYLGRLVELGPTWPLFRQPLHPYTQSLIAAEPRPDPTRRRADLAIKGEIPSVLNRPPACEFHTRCPRAVERCRTETPDLREIVPGHFARCHFAETNQTPIKGGVS